MDRMEDTGSDQLGVRQHQLSYEDRTEQIRRRIDGLINMYATFEEALEEQQPSITDQLCHLDLKNFSARDNISQLLPLITEYEKAVAEWDQWDDYMQVTTTDTPWTRQVYRVRTLFFKDPSRVPPLPQKVQQLIQDYNNTIKAIRSCKTALDAQAQALEHMSAVRSQRSSASTRSRTSTPVPEATLSVADEHSGRATPRTAAPASETAPSAVNEPQIVVVERTAPVSEAAPSAANEHIMSRSFDSTQSSSANNTLPEEPRKGTVRFAATPQPQMSTRTTPRADHTAQPPAADTSTRRVPIVTQLDHGDSSTPSMTFRRVNDGDDDFGPTANDIWSPDRAMPHAGLFSYVDGNINGPYRPAPWITQPGAPQFYSQYRAQVPHGQQATHTVPTFGGGRVAGTPASATAAHPTPPSGNGITSLAGPSTYAQAPPVSTQASSAPLIPDHTRTTAPTGHVTSRPTPPISDHRADVPASAVDPQSTSSFYRAADPNLRLPSTITPPQLVLKEIPIEPFEGDIRKFPTFRTRFLETMQSYPDLQPRHRLQYLLQNLKGVPRSLVDPFPLDDESYWTAIDLLEDRYGNKYRIRNLLQNDILALSQPSTRISDLQQFHDAAYRAMQIMKQVEYDADANNLFGESVLAKLPPTIRQEIIRHPKYTEEKPLSVILAALRQYLNVMAQVEETGATQITVVKGGTATGSNPRRTVQPAQQTGASHNQYTFAAEAEDTYAAPRVKRPARCAYCGRSHFAGRCDVYRTIAQRLRRLRQMNHCLLCLRGGHWSDTCPYKKDFSCRHCASSHPHHVSLCRAYMSHRPGRSPTDPVNKPSPDGGSEALRSNQSKTVNWEGSRNEPAAYNVRFSSAPSSLQDNSKDDRTKKSGKKKKNKYGGTPSSGSGGTYRPTTASAAESISQQDVQAWNGAGLLPGHQSLLQTERCPTQMECAQISDDFARRQYEDDQAWLAELRASEEMSSTDTLSRISDGDIFDRGSEFDDWGEYPETSGYAVSMSSPPDTQAVILECVKATAVNPQNGASREAIVFFDSGSTASYVSTELARALDLPQLEKRKLQINTFAATTTTTLEGFSTTLLLRTQKGQSISLDATAAANIVRSVRTAFVTNDELPQLRRNNCALISTRETPDILIGQDLVHLFERQHEQRLPNGCYVVQTVLGPMVGGAGQVTTTIPRDVSDSNVAGAHGRLDTFCRLSNGAPLDILDRSTSGQRRETQKTSSMSGNPSASKPALSASNEAPNGPPPEETISSYLCGLVEKTDAELLGDFSYLENAGIGTNEMTSDDQAAADMLKTMHQREKDGRFKVPLLFRTATGAPPSNEELPTNAPLAKGRAISTRNSLSKTPEKLKIYDGIIKDYEARGFVEKAPRFTPYPKHCLSHHPVFKDSTTTSTRPVFDASAKLPGRPCLNDWVFRGPVLLPVVPAILLRSRFPIVIIVCDIGKAFLQMSVLDSHKDCLRFYWFKDPFKEPSEANIIEYRFNRVPFGLKSSPYLLAGVIKMHLELEGTPLALEMLKNCYVDNVLLMADNVQEALQKYRQSKAVFAKIQMPLREYASNNAQFNDAIDEADRAELEKLRELGIRWDVTADFWDLPLMPKPSSKPTPSVGNDTTAVASTQPGDTAPSAKHSGPTLSKKTKRKRGKKSDDGRLTKRTMLRFVAQIFDPLGLVQAVILLAKLVIQELWKCECDWDDDVPEALALLWNEAIRDFDKTVIRVPRRIAKSKIRSVEIHVFTDGSSQAYGFTAYLRVKEADGSYSTNLVYSRSKVKPVKDAEKYTIPRMELLGVLLGARAAKFLYQEVSVDITAVYLWSDSTIVLHQVADNEKIKEVFVENRLKEIREIRDQLEIQFRHVPTDDNPADIASRGIAAAELQHCTKWWFGASFLAHDETLWPKQPSSLGEGTPSVPDPKNGLEKYGSDTFTALYTDVFTPPERMTNRRFRQKRKENPLDTITKPLPPTTVSAYAIAAMDQTPRPTRTVKLSAASVLPTGTEEKYPIWTRQVRITYYVLRFAAACLRRLQRSSQELLPRPSTSALGFDLAERLKSAKPKLTDLHITEMIMLKKTQLRHPPSDADRRNLGIFEHHGMLYVKGRLGNMKMRPMALTPLYLPREAKETELLIMDYHRNNCHAGVTATLANIRMRYWFTRGRRTIRTAIYKHCFPCRRETLHPYASPPWPQLPVSRVTRSRPFLFTGVDFFGPCHIRTPEIDGTFQVQKHYVAIFVCMTYRCVHLELCSDLSTQEFLHALRRFGSRREYPARILSDNGTSFLTAREVIQQVHRSTADPQPPIRRNPVRKVVSVRLGAKKAPAPSAEVFLSPTQQPPTGRRTVCKAPSAGQTAAPVNHSILTPDEEQLIDFCQRHKIEWQTITELSPWKGGVYERLIGLIKHCLRRSIGRTKPTVVEFSSLLAEAEHTANSRPLSYIADSETDFFLVRPLDFLIPLLRDETLQTPLDPPVDAETDPNNPDFIAPGQNQLHGKIIKDLKRSRLQADLFWTLFRDGYLVELRSRGVTSKRRQYGEPEIHPGDLVLVWEPNVPRCLWRFALVLEVLPCDDGEIRSARVRFSKTHQEHTRSLAHLYPIGNLPRVPANCSNNCADVYLCSIISESIVDMGSSFSKPAEQDVTYNRSVTAVQEDASSQETPRTSEVDYSDSQTEIDPAPSAGDTSRSATPTDPQTSVDPAPSAGNTDAAEATTSATVEQPVAPALDHQSPTAANTSARATEQADDATVQDANSNVHPLPLAGPRADPEDQGRNPPRTTSTTSTRIGRGAFRNRVTSAAPSTSTTRPSVQPIRASELPPTDVWSTIAQENANTARTRSIRGNWRGRGAFGNTSSIIREAHQAAQHQELAAAPSTHTDQNVDSWSAPDTDSWGTLEQANPTPSVGNATQPQAQNDQNVDPWSVPVADSWSTAEQNRTNPAPTAGNVPLPQAEHAGPSHATSRPQAAVARAPVQANTIALIPTNPILDMTKLPTYPSLEVIKREVLQHFSFESGQQGQRLAKVDDQTLATFPKPKPQDRGFWINGSNRQFGMIPFDPVKLCYGRGENRSHFHQSIRVHRLIVKTTWEKFRLIAERHDLLYMLDKVLNLRVLSFGHMILLEFAVRLRGEHDRMGAIVQFIYDMLKATDFDHDIPRIIHRYHAVMTRGLNPEQSYPSEADLKNAVEHWLCYCHEAFVFFLTHLSGDICWGVDWLQSKELDNAFRRAIRDNITANVHNVIKNLRLRVYQQYVLRHIHALETGDMTYGWTRLPNPRKQSDDGGRFAVNTTALGKTVIFMAEEVWNSAFVKTMKKDDILLNWMPSTNREDILYSIRKFMPGPMTERVIFWFGQTYIYNGNSDYGQLVAELCYHYTTYFGRIDQFVVVPAYDRTHRQVWTQEVLCLYLQRERIVPHARVVLHPYDVRLWQADQPAAEQGAALEPWSNRHQSEQGHIHKFGAVEARKANMRFYHGLDLWTWYMEDHQGELPPPDLYPHCTLPTFQPRGRELAIRLAAAAPQTATGTEAAPSAADVAPAGTSRNTQVSAATASTPARPAAVAPTYADQDVPASPTARKLQHFYLAAAAGHSPSFP